MKKTLASILGLVVLVAAIFFAFFIPWPGRETGPRAWYGDWLPADTLATVGLIDLNSLADSFPASPLGRLFARESMDEILAGLRADPETIRRYDEFHDTVAEIMANPAFRAIFGDDAALALLPPDPQRLRRDPDLELRRSLVAFATSSSSRTMDRLARLVMGRKVSRETVDTVEMTRIRLDDQTTAYAHAQGRALLLALDPGPILACLRVREGQGASLGQDPSFVAARSLWQEVSGQPLVDTFVNAPGLRRLLDQAGAGPGHDAARSLQGVDFLASSVRRDPGELRIVSRAGFHEEELDGRVRAMFAAATANTTLGLVTPQILSYYWSSSLDESVLGGIVSAGEGRERQALDARLRRELGIPLARVLAAFGPQYGFILARIVNSGLFPVPQAILFVQVRDRAAAAEVVAALRRNLARRGMAREESEAVQGNTIYSWPLLPGEATRPALVLTDHMLYLANGRPLLREILGLRPEKGLPPAVVQAMGNRMGTRFGRANYGALALWPSRLAGQVEPTAAWLARLVAASNHVSLTPLNRRLLDLLRSLEIMVAVTSLEENSATSEILFRALSQEPAR